jgi:hypothetical protein
MQEPGKLQTTAKPEDGAAEEGTENILGLCTFDKYGVGGKEGKQN